MAGAIESPALRFVKFICETIKEKFGAADDVYGELDNPNSADAKPRRVSLPHTDRMEDSMLQFIKSLSHDERGVTSNRQEWCMRVGRHDQAASA